jgi:hypothetical protein
VYRAVCGLVSDQLRDDQAARTHNSTNFHGR